MNHHALHVLHATRNCLKPAPSPSHGHLPHPHCCHRKGCSRGDLPFPQPPHDVIETIIHRQGRADETKRGLGVKSKKIHIVPKSEDVKHSLTEQEAKGRQQSHTPVKTVFMRSASGFSCSKINKPFTVAGDHPNHTYICQVKNGLTKKRGKIAFFFRADVSICRTTCP